MPFSTETNKNENNIKFIEKFFDPSKYGPAVDSYPDFNYRVRMAELTDFWPYYSEAKKVPSETQSQYDARVNTSGKLFKNQFIVLNDIIHKDMDVSGMIIGQDYAGHVPEVMFYIEKCELLEGGKEYEVHPKNLNDANFLINGSPQVSFSVHPDLSLKKGYYCYRKTSAVQKNNNKLVAVQSGWEKVAEFSNNDIETYLASVNLDDKKRNVGFSFIDSGVSGYSGWTNELMTSYKVLDSGAVSAKESDRNVNYLRKSRTINHISDPYKSYTLERKVSRISNSAENPPSWDLISPQAQFPYTDTEYLGDWVTGAMDFRISGVYEVIEPMGYYLESDLDYFQVDLVEDWGKSELRDYTFRQDTKELNFEGGESVKLVQKSVSRDNTGPLGGSHDILGVVEASFSPNSIGVSGSITGSGNASNFYQLEYQLVPKEEESKKLYYQEVSDVNDTISVGDRVFFNSGSNKDDNDDDVYTPIETNVFGDSVEQLDSISPIAIEAASKDQEEYIGPSLISGVFHTMEPQEVSSYESSGVGYSTFSSGEKYLVVPKGGYNTLDSDRTLLSYSAGETRSTFYQGDQKWPNTDEELQYALTEYRTFDPVNNTEEPYCFNKEREIRISDQALCLGDSATEIPDRKLDSKVYLLDYEYGSDQVLRNASILNIDHLDGSIKKSNLSSSKEEFERKPNLFFEKRYIGAVTILATGQKQAEDASMLKEIMSTEMSEGASVFYLERDIYIDSDVSTQANSRAPSVFSSSSAGPAEAFALNENTRNPQSRGEEKLYLTETYHTDFDNYPFNDSSYYTKRPNIIEEFKYSDHKDGQDKLFRLTNVENESTYIENDFGCIVNYERDDPYSIDGYNLLSYLGVSLTATASSSDPLTTGNYDPIKNTVDIQGFVPSNTGVYYEFQVRDRAQSYNWETMLHAKEIHAGNIDDFPVGHSLLAETHANVDVRALEWNKSNIITNINAIKVANESPDSLILKSNVDKFYDESKFEHSIISSNVETDEDNFDNTFDPAVDVMDLDGDMSLSLASHRSFDIQNGNFSMEFWIKPDSSHSGIGYVAQRGKAFQVLYSSNKIQFKVNGDDHLESTALSTSDWSHVAIVARINRISRDLDLSLFINGVSKSSKKVSYGDLSGQNGSALIVGKGLTAKLYGLRIYIGKSNYTEEFKDDVPTAPFEREANPRSYKILKYTSSREASSCNWVINKNTFNNVSPPSQYREASDEAETFHMSEWVAASSTTEELSSSYNRAVINYINGYAYSAPNNPHINKNYEGTPIVKTSGGLHSLAKLSEQLDSIVFDNYEYIDRLEGEKQSLPAPYLYEYTKGNDLDLVRFHKKGGYDMELQDRFQDRTFDEGSRLRITKYVYKVYTKRAVVVGDVGYKNSRGHQSGWNYQLQYSTDSGSIWKDLASDAVSQAENIFYNNEYSIDSSPDGFSNISSFSSLPMVLLKTDITKKYKPEEIEFRIIKKQNLNLGATGDTGKVLKKLNFLPLGVDIPSANCLLNMTQQSEYSKVDGTHEAEVKLDPDRAYILIKDEDETILKSSDSKDKLQISSLSFSTTHPTRPIEYTDEAGFVNNTLTDLPDGRPIEVKGLTGLRITRNSLTSLGDIETVIGPKPSGLILNRVEKSYIGKSDNGYTYTGESFGLSFDKTKAFITPSIIGSHFEELDDFNKFADQPNDPVEASLINFSCKSYASGEAQISIETGVSGLQFSPLDKFYNSPVITSDIAIGEEDAGKTFITSGNVTLTKNDSTNIEVANIHGTLGGVSAITSSTPVPTATVAYSDDVVIIQDSGRVNIAGDEASNSANIVNIFSGDNNNVKFDLGGNSTNTLAVNKDVVFVEHGKINLTEDDAGQIIVIDSSADIILPSGFSDWSEENDQSITFLNATKYEAKVDAGTSKVDNVTSQQKIGSKKTNTDYIPKETARKYTYSGGNWSASDVDLIKFNQLNLTDSDFSSTGNTIVHNEDVDIRITDKVDGDETIIVSTDDKYVNIVRNQVNNFDIEDDLTDWSTPIIRVYIDEVLNHIAPSGSLGIRISKTSGGWEFKKIKPIVFNEVVVTPESAGNIYSYSGDEDSLSMRFVGFNNFVANFKIFLISNREFLTDTNLDVYSDKEEFKFLDKNGDEIGYFFNARMDRNTVFSISWIDALNFLVKEEDQSNVYKFNQPDDAATRVKINRNDNFSLELPTLGGEFDYDEGFDLVFCNFSETSCDTLTPKEESFTQPSVVPSFKSRNYKYVNSNNSESSYDNFKTTANIKDSSSALNDGDFVVLDGSLSDDKVNLKSFKSDSYIKKEHKFSYDRLSSSYNFDGEIAKYITFDHTSSKFTLTNHELVTHQKLVFNCDKLFVSDHYHAGDAYSLVAYNGETTTSGGETVTKGESILAYLNGVYSFFVWTGSYVRKLTIEMPPTYEGFFDTNYQIHLVEEEDRLYTYIRSRDKVYDFSGNTEGLLTEKALVRRISFDFSVNPEDYISDTKKQTFFVKVIDDNIFELYKDKDLTEQIDSKASSIANPFTLLSDTFYVENINSSSLNVINLGNSTPAIKNYSEGVDIIGVSPLTAVKESTIHQHASNIYTSGDALPSGVYLASGYKADSSTDTLDIDALSKQDTISLTDKFHAAGDLNHDDFNDKYFINAGMDEVVVTNTNGSTDKKIAKNRVEKHINNDNFTPQDQNTDDRDLIYYPKNELHVLDRKYLGKNSEDQAYNFVFFRPDEHSDDLKIVLPDTWTNLGQVVGGAAKKLAVANLHDRQVTVSNFTGDKSFTLNADSVVFMDAADDYVVDNKSLFTGAATDDLEGFTIAYDEDAREVSVTKDKVTEIYYITKPSDIILDHSMHNGKKILVDGPVNFLRPYLRSKDGSVDYSGENYNNQTNPSVPTAFYIANISKDPVSVSVDSQWSDLASNGLLHSSQFYAAELDAFVIPDDYGEYFGHMTLAADASSSGAFSYSGSSLDQTKTYNIFGIELSLKLNVYTSRISAADAEKINQVLSLEQAGGMMSVAPTDDEEPPNLLTSAEDFDYKISGIGASDISRLKIVNSVYENVRIDSVVIKGDILYEEGELTGADHVVLGSKIKSWFDEEQIALQNVFSSYEIRASEGKEWDTSYSQSVVPKFLAKNRALVLSLTEIIAPKYNQDMDGCSAFGFELDDDGNGKNYDLPSKVSASDWGVVQSSFIKTDRKDVRVLKKDSVAISLADAALGDVGQNRSITCLSDPFDVVLPVRKSVGDKDFDFIIVNGSHSSINIISPEGTATNILDVDFTDTIPAASSRKISYKKGTKTFAVPVEVETSVLGKALFRDDLDVFLVNSKTTDVSPFLISGSTDKDKKNELKVINNTGHALYIQATSESDGSDANGTQKIIPKDNYLWVLSDGNGLSARDESDGVAGTNVPLIGIRDGSVSISEKAYSKEVVLFNSDRVSLFDMVRTASTDTNFFSTTFVPFINDTDFKRYYPARATGRAGGFTLRNDDESPLSKFIPGLAPVKIGTDGKPEDTDIGVSCHLFEFILKNVNSKVVYPNKDYDYIFTDSADFSCTLYNGLGDDTNFYQLNSDGDLEEGEAGSYKTSDSVKGKAVIGINQDVGSITLTKGQVYFEQKLEDDLVDYKSFLYPRFYLNKDFYKDKTIVFKDPFEIIYSFTDGQDYYFGEADTVTLVNISKASCLTKTKVKIEPDFYYIESSSPSSVIRPKYNLNPNGSLYVLRHLADVEQASMDNLKIANVSRGTINVTYDPGDLNLKWKIFSSERADFKLTAFAKDFYVDKKGNEITKNIPPVDKIYVKYSEVRKQDKRDWFIRLTDLDVPHLIKDVNYFNELEWEMERKTEKLGQINVDYNAVRFKFSNIFRTNRQEAAEGQTGFHTIEDYDDPYRFGVTLLSNRRGITKNIFFDKDVSEQFFPLYLKLPWDIPKDIVAYMLSTGHERLSRCLHFNERNGEITLDGINQNKYYSLSSEVSSSYDFTHSVKENTLAGFNGKNYTGIEKNKEFKPSLIYNGIVYYNGQKITGVGGVSEYKLRFPYFSTLEVSQFSGMVEEEEDIMEFQSDKLALQEEADNQTFNWNKVCKTLHENDFLSGRVESIASHHASDKHELILGRKIKDIDGSHRYDPGITYQQEDGEEVPKEETHWRKSRWFRFQIPLNAGFTYTKSGVPGVEGSTKGGETIIIRDSVGADKKIADNTEFVAEKGDAAEVDVYFLDANYITAVEQPGYEYEISSSLKYNRDDVATDKKIMQISLEPKDSLPFIADGIISSLNEDFASPDADEYTIKALDNLKQKHKNKTNDGTWRDKITSLKDYASKTLELDESYKIASNAITSLSSNQIYQSLKNNLGHSFVPAFGITSGRNPMVGFTFNLKRNLRSYKAIRFRLKKLTDREIIFDDFAKEEKLKDYFTNNPTEANLRYELNTNIDSIAYQDIAHPGGVVTMPHSEWTEVDLSGGLLRLSEFDDCDAIVFKEDGTDIIAGKPYFLRARAVEPDDDPPTYDYDVLKIFNDDVDAVGNFVGQYDTQLKVNSSLAAGQKYKIVNYFNLAKRKGESGHRGQTPLVNKLYPEGLDLTEYPSLSFPIIVGSKKFFLERPVYRYPDSLESFAVWADTVWKKEKGVFKVRANLELSEIAQAFLSDGDKISEMELFNNGNRTLWRDEDIFGGVKNLLSRPNVQMQMISWNEKTERAKIHVKLTKGREYRCLYSESEDKEIHSITINGAVKTDSFCDIFSATTEDFFVEMNYKNIGEVDVDELGTKDRLFSENNKKELFSYLRASICLTESATFVDQTVKVNSDMNKADYLDYQIPILNNGNERDFGFSNPDDFYYTEGYDRIYTRNQRQENLTDTNKEHGLMYDGPMPADIKYIYPRCENEGILSFYVSNDYWNGFIDRFETEDQYGSKSNRTRPKNINFTLQKLTSGVWGGGDINIDSITENLGTATVTTRGRDLEDNSLQTGSTVTITGATPEAYNASFEVTVTGDTTFTFSIEEGAGDASGIIVANVKGHNIGLADDKTFLTAKRSGKTAYATVACVKAKVGETYRLIVTNENVEYYKDGKEHYFSNSSMRVPFEWKSTIFASDVTSVENTSRTIFEHRLNLTENHLLQKSIAFPKDGVSRFGSYDYKRRHYDLGIKVPFTRLYMYRLNHSLSYVYVDKITQGGITKIEIIDAGANYRLPPVVSVSAPTLGLAGERTATANAQIESGKIKHVEVLDAGSGYSDLNELKTNKFISNSWGRGTTVEKEWLIQVAKFTYAFTLNGTKTVTHDGVKNIVFGSYVSGTGITPGTKVTRVNSSTEFEISDDATESGVQNLTIDLTERQMPYISFEEQFGIETAPVSLTPVYPEEYPKEHPLYVDACQEEFGIDFAESEEIADYVDSVEGSALAKDAVSAVTNYVETLQGVVEDPNWNKFPPGYLGKTLGEVSEGDNSSIMEANEISTYGITTEDEYVDSSQGTEHPSVAGLYTADDRDALSEISITVGENGEDCITETFASIDPASLVAVINNHSLAEYRVVENQIANKATPWISSFSRSQNPSMPKGFGINPGSPVSSEVFNAYARAVNNLYLLSAYVPIFAKIRKFRQYEYRYIEDMAGLTFKLDDPEEAGEEKGGYSGRDEVAAYYTTWQHESKINKINYLDPTEHKWKDAWFSAEFDGTGKNWASIIKDENKYNIYDEEDKKDLIAELWPNDIHAKEAKKNQEEYMKNAGTTRDDNYTPNHIGLPTVVNIPEELGVFCNPKAFDKEGHPAKAAGLLLPELLNRRAVAFGGKLVHSSEVYDVTDEDGRIASSIVNIAGSDIIDSFYENEIIFGCQVTGKPFWSTFLKTTKEWTEFEIVPSPSFMKAISDEETLGNLTGIKGAVTRQTTVCHNEEYAKVEKRLYGDEKHSLCTGGSRSSSDYRFNYEGLFNLREGDPIVGPVNRDHEIVFDHSFGGQGVHVFRLEPEFTQALAVYGSNHYISLARYHSKSNFPSGPCIHTCSPSASAYFTASDEQLVFDLRSGSKSRPLNTTTRMPNLTNAYNNPVDPSTGDATVGG